jgi:hypothetical protein
MTGRLKDLEELINISDIIKEWVKWTYTNYTG